MAEVQRGTLHVVLTEQGDEGLKLSDKATGLRSEASTEAEAFTLGTFMDGGMELDVQATATAVCAEVKRMARRIDRAGDLSKAQYPIASLTNAWSCLSCKSGTPDRQPY